MQKKYFQSLKRRLLIQSKSYTYFFFSVGCGEQGLCLWVFSVTNNYHAIFYGKCILFQSDQINVVLLIFSLSGFLLPGYLLFHRRQLCQMRAEGKGNEHIHVEDQAVIQPLTNGHSNGHVPQEA